MPPKRRRRPSKPATSQPPLTAALPPTPKPPLPVPHTSPPLKTWRPQSIPSPLPDPPKVVLQPFIRKLLDDHLNIHPMSLPGSSPLIESGIITLREFEEYIAYRNHTILAYAKLSADYTKRALHERFWIAHARMKELGEITHVVEVLRGKTQHWDSLMCRRADDAKDCIDLIKEMMILWQKDGEPGIEDIEKLTKQSFGLL